MVEIDKYSIVINQQDMFSKDIILLKLYWDSRCLNIIIHLEDALFKCLRDIEF